MKNRSPMPEVDKNKDFGPEQDHDEINEDGKRTSNVDIHPNEETTLQTPEEHEKDKATDQKDGDKIEIGA